MNDLAVHYLAKVLTENFVGTKLIGCEADEEGFCCEAEVRSKVSLAMLTEAMEDQLARGEAVESVEMVPVSAKGMFEYRKQEALAQSVADDRLVSLVRIGSYYGLCPPLEETRLGAFTLDGIEGEGRVRIRGGAAGNRKELKKVKKKVCFELDFYSVVEGEVVLHPKGRRVGEALIRWWEEINRQDGVELVATPGGSLEEIMRLRELRGGERYGEIGWGGDRTYIFVEKEGLKQARISSLQFLEQGAKMLGLESHFGGLEVTRVRGLVVITRKMFGSVPQMVARLVETHQGKIPQWLFEGKERLVSKS